MDPSRLHGLSFLVGGMYSATMFSSYMSSPWTIANVGADDEHAATAKKLILASFLVGGAAAGIGAYIDGNPYPLYGAAFAGVTFFAAYGWALKKAQGKGYTGLNQGMSK